MKENEKMEFKEMCEYTNTNGKDLNIVVLKVIAHESKGIVMNVMYVYRRNPAVVIPVIDEVSIRVEDIDNWKKVR